MDGAPNRRFDTAAYLPPVDQVQEFNIQTNSFDAEYGHGGAYVNITTRSGGNKIHGSVYEFLRNDAFNATNFFSNRAGLDKPVLRFHQFGAAAERFNNMSRWVFAAPNPIEAPARAAYARSPIPELPADQFRVLGGLSFATPEDRRAARADANDWTPCIGLAYRLTGKTVVRAGYGHFYDYWSSSDFGQDGFSSSTPMVSTIDEVTPPNLFRDPFPSGLIRPPGRSQGMTTLLRTSLQVFQDRDHTPCNERWQPGLQRELTKDLRLAANYVGEPDQRQLRPHYRPGERSAFDAVRRED